MEDGRHPRTQARRVAPLEDGPLLPAGHTFTHPYIDISPRGVIFPGLTIPFKTFIILAWSIGATNKR